MYLSDGRSPALRSGPSDDVITQLSGEFVKLVHGAHSEYSRGGRVHRHDENKTLGQSGNDLCRGDARIFYSLRQNWSPSNETLCG